MIVQQHNISYNCSCPGVLLPALQSNCAYAEEITQSVQQVHIHPASNTVLSLKNFNTVNS